MSDKHESTEDIVRRCWAAAKNRESVRRASEMARERERNANSKTAQTEFCDAAAVRGALEAIISGYEKADFCDMNYGEWCHNRHDPANACANVALCKAVHEARAALAAPARNCEEPAAGS